MWKNSVALHHVFVVHHFFVVINYRITEFCRLMDDDCCVMVDLLVVLNHRRWTAESCRLMISSDHRCSVSVVVARLVVINHRRWRAEFCRYYEHCPLLDVGGLLVVINHCRWIAEICRLMMIILTYQLLDNNHRYQLLSLWYFHSNHDVVVVVSHHLSSVVHWKCLHFLMKEILLNAYCRC